MVFRSAAVAPSRRALLAAERATLLREVRAVVRRTLVHRLVFAALASWLLSIAVDNSPWVRAARLSDGQAFALAGSLLFAALLAVPALAVVRVLRRVLAMRRGVVLQAESTTAWRRDHYEACVDGLRLVAPEGLSLGPGTYAVDYLPGAGTIVSAEPAPTADARRREIIQAAVDAVFGTDPQDHAANREGRLGPAQRRRLARRLALVCSVAVGTLLPFVLGASVRVLRTGSRVLLALTGLWWGACVAFYVVGKFSRDLRGGRVVTTSGVARVTTVRYARSLPLRKLSVGDGTFDSPRILGTALPPSEPCTAYTTPDAGFLVGILVHPPVAAP